MGIRNSSTESCEVSGDTASGWTVGMGHLDQLFQQFYNRWYTSLVCVPKKDGRVSIRGDYKVTKR